MYKAARIIRSSILRIVEGVVYSYGKRKKKRRLARHGHTRTESKGPLFFEGNCSYYRCDIDWLQKCLWRSHATQNRAVRSPSQAGNLDLRFSLWKMLDVIINLSVLGHNTWLLEVDKAQCRALPSILYAYIIWNLFWLIDSDLLERRTKKVPSKDWI